MQKTETHMQAQLASDNNETENKNDSRSVVSRGHLRAPHAMRSRPSGLELDGVIPRIEDLLIHTGAFVVVGPAKDRVSHITGD